MVGDHPLVENFVESFENVGHGICEKYRSLVVGNYVIEKRGEIPPAVLRSKTGFYFGQYNWQSICKAENQDGHIFIVGPSGSGKSKSVALHQYKTWRSPIFANDMKGELSKKTKHFRKQYKIINPADRNSVGYNMFYRLETSDNLSREATTLANFIVPKTADDKNPFFKNQARRYLAAVIIYYFLRGYGFIDMIDDLFDPENDRQELAREIRNSGKGSASRKIGTMGYLKEDTFVDIMNTLDEDIELYATDDDLRHFLSKDEVYTFADLDDGFDIYLQVPEDKEDIYMPIKAVITHDTITEGTARVDEGAEPILCLLDEFLSMGEQKTVANKLRTLRSKKIILALFVQDVGLMDHIYGTAVRNSILANCTYKLILGAADPLTAKVCEDICGKVMVKRVTKSYSQEEGSSSPTVRITESSQLEPVIEASEFYTMIESPKRHQKGRKRLKDREEIILRSPFGLHRLERKFYQGVKNFTA